MKPLTVKITKAFTFDAAHFLPEHEGKCAAMHGHTYRLEVSVARADGRLIAEGPSAGMVIDFFHLNQLVKAEIIDKVDHTILNDVFTFRTTSENLACHFYQVLAQKLGPLGVRVATVKLWETPTSYVEVGDE